MLPEYKIGVSNGSLERLIQQERMLFVKRTGTLDIIFMTCMLAIVGLVGAVGNSIVLAVYRKPDKKQYTQSYIFAMAACDLAVCGVIIPYRVASYHVIMDIHFCKIFETLTFSTVSFSIFLLVVIAIDRYIAVSRPLVYSDFGSHANSIIFVTAVIACAISLPGGIMMGKFVRVVNTNGTTLMFQYTGVCHGSGQDGNIITESGGRIYNIILFAVYIILLTTIAVLYLCIFHRVYKRRKIKASGSAGALENHSIEPTPMPSSGGESMNVATISNQVGHLASNGHAPKYKSAHSRAHMRTARMLLLVTVVFVVTWVPFMLIRNKAIPNIASVRLTFFISSMCNPIIYSFTNAQFRMKAKRLFAKRAF